MTSVDRKGIGSNDFAGNRLRLARAAMAARNFGPNQPADLFHELLQESDESIVDSDLLQ
jgi:hypothetical protein